MNRTRIIRFLGALALLVVVVVLATVLGRWYGQNRAEAAKAEDLASLDEYLHSTIQNIGKGYPFPDITLWPADGGNPKTVKELLPNGGLLLYFASECEVCVGAINTFGQAWEQSEYQSTPVAVVTGGHSDMLLAPLHASGCKLMLYRDIEDILRQQYGLSNTRVFFALNDEGLVAAMGPMATDDDYFDELLRQFQK